MFSDHPGDVIPQLDAMRQGIDYRLEITVRSFSCFFRPLTIRETQQVAARVAERFRNLPENAKSSLSENVLLCKETIQLASTSDVGKTDATITERIMDDMTADELQFLHRQYVAACDKVNPCLEKMPMEEIAKLVEAIKKKHLHLTELSFLQAVNVSRYMIFGE